MGAASREDAIAPAPLRRAPDRATTPLPGTYGLVVDPATTSFDHGAVLLGGSPLRLLRLSKRPRELMARWNAGAPVGGRRAEQLLARRLVSSGVCLPRPAGSRFGPDDVTVVIPVRDRPDQLRTLLRALTGLRCIVVDDASEGAGVSAAIARSAGAHFIGLTRNVGPAGARNAGTEAVTTPLVAFVDSDCVPSEGWLGHLLGHFDDPLVAAVAPRVVPAAPEHATWLSRYEAVSSSLDRGPAAGLVRPLSRIPYVPSAAIVIRTELTGPSLFDPRLRGGEDVDAVWRLVEAGWDVRYEPTSTVAHAGPDSARSFIARRAFYGTTAGPLALRHPDALSPLNTTGWTAAVWALLIARRPLWAAGTLAATILLLARRLDPLVEHPLAAATTIAGGGTARSTVPALGGLTRAWSPALALGLLARRTRRACAVALLAPACVASITDRGQLDPLRYVAAHVADDLAYGTGVWRGCLAARTVRPLIPRITWRARTWSRATLRAQTPRGPGKD
jgi:mycofactocin system glycosyltransferase